MDSEHGKSKRSKRTVPLPPWLAARVCPTCTAVQKPTQPSGTRVPRTPLAMGTSYESIFRPALSAVGLPVSAPEVPATTTAPAVQATRGVRLQDLRHTFAVMQLMAGVHFMRCPSGWGTALSR